MKKSDLIKLAVLGISSATMISSQVYAQGDHSCSGSPGQDTPAKNTVAPTKSDGSANYSSNTSSSLQQPNASQGSHTRQADQSNHSGGSQNGSKSN
jgi:hypothetical protein